MLRALGHPVSFVGLLVGFLVAIVAATAAQQSTAKLLGVRIAPRERGVAGWIDPYGAVAAILGGPGWGITTAGVTKSKARRCAVYLVGPLVAIALGAAALAGFAAKIGGRQFLYGADLGQVVHGLTGPADQVLLICAGLEAVTVGLLLLVPLPPLPGWHVLALFVRPTVSWQRTRMYLEERNIGVLILLVLTVLPLGGDLPILVQLLDFIVGRILRAVAG